MDDGGIDDRAPGQLQTLLFQVLMHLEQRQSQLVALQQVTELAERGLVRHRLAAQVDVNRPGFAGGCLVWVRPPWGIDPS